MDSIVPLPCSAWEVPSAFVLFESTKYATILLTRPRLTELGFAAELSVLASHTMRNLGGNPNLSFTRKLDYWSTEQF